MSSSSVSVDCKPCHFDGGELSINSQETQTDFFVIPDPVTDLQTEDSLSTSTEVSGVASTIYGELGIDPNALFVDFIPGYNSTRGFHINDLNYYKSITKVIERLVQSVDSSEGFAYSSIIYANFENVNHLTHSEFLSPEYQGYLRNHEPIRTFARNDLIFEDRNVCMEDCKKIVMARRDFFQR